MKNFIFSVSASGTPLLLLLFVFLSCKKEDEVPNKKLPFEIVLISTSKGGSSEFIEVNPSEKIEVNFRVTSTQKFLKINAYSKDWVCGVNYLNDFPISNFDEARRINGYQIISPFEVQINLGIRVPSFSRDTVRLWVEAIDIDNRRITKDIFLVIKNPVGMKFGSYSVLSNRLQGQGDTIFQYPGDYLTLHGNYISSYNVSKVELVMDDGLVPQVFDITSIANQATPCTYFSPYCGNCVSEYSNFSFYLSRLYYFSSDQIGKTFRMKFTVFNENGEKLEAAKWIKVGYPKLSLYPGIFIGGPTNTIYKPFYAASDNSLIYNFSPFYGTFGFPSIDTNSFIASCRYIYQNAASLGYSNIVSGDSGGATFFQKVSVPFHSISYNFLDSVIITSSSPEIIKVVPGDVLLFSSFNGKKGAMVVKSLNSGRTGYLVVDIKYEPN